jgi:hypothetical protein
MMEIERLGTSLDKERMRDSLGKIWERRLGDSASEREG